VPDIPITVASGEYDRIRAIRDGTVKVEGCAVAYHVVEPNQLFVRNLKHQEFDVSEMSFSTYITLRDQGTAHYTAIPVFLSRAFRHSAIFVRTDRGIASPADLKGKRIGTPEYLTTMLVWMRGLLSDEYGIKPSDLRWRLGGLEQAATTSAPSPLVGEGRGGGSGGLGAGVPQTPTPTPDPSPAEPAYTRGSATSLSDRSRVDPTSVGGGEKATHVEIETIPPGKTLAGMLAEGDLDAVFSARPPSCFLRGAANVARLFPDYRTTEQAYYRKAGIYPLMHAVGIRNSLVEQHPWMAKNLFDAFAKAKAMAVADFEKLAAFALTLPWIEAEYRATQAVLGPDIWPYGIAASRKAIDTLCRYLHEQGFTTRQMGTAELFAPMG
jgi:4,5-dihydroxyphthalate decarboxylase